MLTIFEDIMVILGMVPSGLRKLVLSNEDHDDRQGSEMQE